jgi:iron complex outermembrane receptor protein
LPALAQPRDPAAGLEIVVTARLREENAQTVPISMSIVGGDKLDVTPLTSNVQQIIQLVPSLNYVSPNPRNTAFTIRGLGSSVVAISQANDGLEPGVGFYVDQVYHARPATAAFDFLDLDRVEVLRGPQGTLFGKNTTAGAINISSRAPTADPTFMVEASHASDDYRQLKAAANGPLGDGDGDVTGRLSAQITQRDGVLYNARTGRNLNDIGTTGARGQIAFAPSDELKIRVSADHSSFDSSCCTQVYFGVAPTLKSAARQYSTLAAGQSYAPPSLDPFEGRPDIDGDLLVNTSEGGVATIVDRDFDGITLTSVTAWRYWQWDAENDRDYTGLSIQTSQHIPSRQDQYSQEIRFASNGDRKIDYVAGLYWFTQTIEGRPITVYGPLAAYWLLGPPPGIPSNLLDGYTRFDSDSYAAFGEITWRATDRLSLTAGTRYTWEDKHGTYDARVSGGLDTTGNAALTNSKLSILRPQSYVADIDDDNGSGRLVFSYELAPAVMGYATYNRGYKSGGINMSGLPLDAANQPALATAVVEPERNTTYELGVKMELLERRWLLNIAVYDTAVRNFQANVVDTGPGALRGYLANIDKVSVRGAELDSAFALGARFTGRAAVAYTDGVYDSYANGPCPIERIGNSTTVCDLSGRQISAQPRLTQSLGGEYHWPMRAHAGAEGYVNVDVATRSHTYGDPSDSQYTVLDGYTLVNASVGVRNLGPFELSLWARNLLDEDYMQNLTVQAGNSGLIVGTPSDPRSVGLTLRAVF